MKFIPVRDLRNAPAQVWEALDEGDDLVLTANGKPRAIVIRVEGEDLEETLAHLRRARAQGAVSRMREAARTAGTSGLDPAQVDEEIALVRRARRS